MANKNSKNRVGLVLFLMLLVIVGGCVLLNTRDSVPTAQTPQPLSPKVVKTGAGVELDYSSDARALNQRMVARLQDAKFAIAEQASEPRDVKLSDPEGKVKWETMSLVISLEAVNASDYVQKIEQILRQAGAEIFASERSLQQGRETVRIDAGLKDKVEGKELTLTTMRLTITGGKTEQTSKTAPPAGPGRGKLAIIIDDVGHTLDGWTTFMSIDRPLTFAVFPHHTHTGETARGAHTRGQQVMVHLPIEPLSADQVESEMIMVAMSDQEIKAATARGLAGVPYAIGINNHKGSRGTTDRRVMQAILATVKEKGLFFVDSRTNPNSVAYNMASTLGIRTGKNEYFLDNDPSVEAVKNRIRGAAKLALQHGQIIAIGHARENTARAIAEILPEIEGQGVRLVFTSEVLN